jgi:hypothetical protein
MIASAGAKSGPFKHQIFVRHGACGATHDRYMFPIRSPRRNAMASINAQETETEPLSWVTIASGVNAEFGAALRGSEPIVGEEVAGIRAEPVMNLAWLDAVETALRRLQDRNAEDPVLVEAVAVAARLRAALGASGASPKAPAALWMCLYCCISLPFLNHFSSAIGDELGHAMAHQIVKVLSDMAHHLEF